MPGLRPQGEKVPGMTINTRAKGARLERKSIEYCRDMGAVLIFRGKGTQGRFGNVKTPGTTQIDLIVFFKEDPIWFLEVTVPKNKARAEKRLRELQMIPGVIKYIHLWHPNTKQPQEILVLDSKP